MLYTDIQNFKKQLNIELSYVDDDVILQTLLNASEQAVVNYCNAIVTGTTATTLNLSGSTMNVTMNNYTGNHTGVSVAVVQATYMLASHLYTNRQIISFGQGLEIPYTLKFILDPYRNFAIA